MALSACAVVVTLIASVMLYGALPALMWLPWAALGAAGVLDLLMSVRRSREIAFDAPVEAYVGESFALTLTDSRAHPQQRVRLQWPDGLAGPEELEFQPPPSGHRGTAAPAVSSSARAEVNATRRGAWEIPHVWLLWPSRLGLWEFVPCIPLGARVRVVPNVRLAQSGALTTQVASALFGIKESRAVGDGSEFHQLRDFVPGMDVKSIDWKRSARKRSLVAKELHAERNHHVVIALDNGFIMSEEIAGMARLDHAATAALAVGWAAVVGGDLVGHYSYDAQPRAFSRPEAGRNSFVRLRRWVSDLAYEHRETNHTLGLSHLNTRTPKRSLIIVFTDFIDTTSAELMVENIGLLSKRHLVVFVAIRDPDLAGGFAETPGNLTDVAKYVAANHSVTQRRLVLEKLSRLGVTVIDAEPAQITGRLVSAYLDIKERELI